MSDNGRKPPRWKDTSLSPGTREAWKIAAEWEEAVRLLKEHPEIPMQLGNTNDPVTT